MLGIVILVALVVITATAVGMQAFGFTEAMYDPTQVAVSVEQTDPAGNAENSAEVRFELDAGGPIAEDALTVSIDGTRAANSPVDVTYTDGELAMNSPVVVNQSKPTDLIGGERIKLVLRDGSEESILAETTVRGGGASAQSPYFVFTAYALGSNPGEPWSVTEDAGGCGLDVEVEVRGTHAAVGDRSLYLLSESPSHGYSCGASVAEVSIDINLTEVATITFDYYEASDHQKVLIDGTEQSVSIASGRSSWRTASLDVSGYSGTHTVSFYLKEETVSSRSSSFIDDVRFLDAAGEEVPAEKLLD